MEENNRDEILKKAEYCLNCPNKPCSMKGCPLNNDIPLFIKSIRNEDYEEAYKILSKTTVLPAVCGRICPHKKQCQGKCIRGINGKAVSIGELEAFIGDVAIEKNYKLFGNEIKYGKKKVAVIGGGPTGLTCAAYLAKNGVNVTIYEKNDFLGGLLAYGIPRFRLSKQVVQDTIKKILDIGIEVKYNMELGKNINISELQNEYDAVFLSFGANVSEKMKIEGEELRGVFGGNELLQYNLHPNYTGKCVAIIGGGNVAMDCARTIKRMGAKSVKVIYRRSQKEMPAEEKEIEDAKEEGVEFLFQTNIVKIIGKEKNSTSESQVEKIELIKTKLYKVEGETREKPVNIEGSNYQIDMDYVVRAIGSRADDFVKKMGLELDTSGEIKIHDKCRTSLQNVFAGGDIAGNIRTVAWAARSGYDAAEEIIEYLKNL